MHQDRRVYKAKADVVFLLDVTGSMGKCIQAVKDNLITFASTLDSELIKIRDEGPNEPRMIPDIRYKVVGYRDQPTHREDCKWYVNFPFVKTVEELKKQFDHPDMVVKGGADEPESLLDALYMLGSAPQSGIQDVEDPSKWRYAVPKVVAIFTDATFHLKATLPEIKDLDIHGVYEKIYKAKLRLFGLVPGWHGYDALSSFPRTNLTPFIKADDIPKLGEDSAEGSAAQDKLAFALMAYSDPKRDSFKRLIESIGCGTSQEVKGYPVD